jgi:mannonate dehydratase
MEQTWRWFGPDDAVRLNEIRQAGATGIVTALHQIPAGQLWSVAAIEERKRLIEADASLGLRWSVVESLPVAEPIKIGEGDLATLFDDYRQSLRNLAACGVDTVCYNFMPVLDWTRTELRAPMVGGGTGLRFNAHEFAAFDCYMLKREGAEADHAPGVLRRARAWFDGASDADKAKLLANIMAGLPGAFDRYDLPGLRTMLARYRDVSAARLRENLARFLREVCPVADEVGIRLGVHPDDPPRSLLRERHYALHRLAWRREGQRPSRDRGDLCTARELRPPAQRDQGGGWLVLRVRAPRRRRRHGVGGDHAPQGTEAAARRRRCALAYSVPARSRARAARRCQARHASRLSGGRPP